MRLLKLFSFALLAVLVSLISTGVTHATITVDGPFIDTSTQGDWRGKYDIGGSCFYLLPTPPPEKWTEFPLNTTDDPNVCVGGSFIAGNKLTWNMFSGQDQDPKPIYVYYFDPLDYPYQTGPGADQWNPCANDGHGAFYGATFDNGDLIPPREIIEPLVSEVTVDYTGSFRIAYYFLEDEIGCREQKYKLFVNGELKAEGMVADFGLGKYAYFDISGLSGTSTIRFEVVNTRENPVCNYGNVHFSGIFIDQCCTGAIGDYVWHDDNKNGKQDADEYPLANVIVTLTKPDGTKITATTNALGYYQFSNLCSGTYKVEVGTPTGYKPTICNSAPTASDPTIAANQTDSNCSGVMVPLAYNTSNQTIDFGFYKTMCPGTGTPGYWKNHPEAWPVESITVGGVTYTKAKAIALMDCSTTSNKLFTMFPQLVAAKLNVLMGCGGSCIDGIILKADAWMANNAPNGMPLTCGGKPIVYAGSKAWKAGEPLYWTLDKYNNGKLYVSGKLCAPSR